jgi:hypothetical protein
VIITSALDDVHRTISACNDEAKVKEGKGIVEKIAKLKYEIQHDRVLTPLADDGQPDVEDYNEELQALGPPKWLNVPWLFSECYLYRFVHSPSSFVPTDRQPGAYIRCSVSQSTGKATTSSRGRRCPPSAPHARQSSN